MSVIFKNNFSKIYCVKGLSTKLDILHKTMVYNIYKTEVLSIGHCLN